MRKKMQLQKLCDGPEHFPARIVADVDNEDDVDGETILYKHRYEQNVPMFNSDECLGFCF